MGILSIEEEYWTVQYLTRVAGMGAPIFWPSDGEGKYDTEAMAIERATALLDTYPSTRTVHVVRRMAYAIPLLAPDTST